MAYSECSGAELERCDFQHGVKKAEVQKKMRNTNVENGASRCMLNGHRCNLKSFGVCSEMNAALM